MGIDSGTLANGTKKLYNLDLMVTLRREAVVVVHGDQILHTVKAARNAA